MRPPWQQHMTQPCLENASWQTFRDLYVHQHAESRSQFSQAVTFTNTPPTHTHTHTHTHIHTHTYTHPEGCSGQGLTACFKAWAQSPLKARLGLHWLQKSLLSPRRKKKSRSMQALEERLDWDTSLKMCHMMYIDSLCRGWGLSIPGPRYWKLDTVLVHNGWLNDELRKYE